MTARRLLRWVQNKIGSPGGPSQGQVSAGEQRVDMTPTRDVDTTSPHATGDLYSRLSSDDSSGDEEEDSYDAHNTGGNSCDESEEEEGSEADADEPRTPVTRKRKFVMVGSRSTRLRKKRRIVTDAAANRIRVAVLVEDAGMSKTAACALVKVHRFSENKGKWVQRYRDGGMDALLEDSRSHAKVKMTPRTQKVVMECAKKGENAGEIQGHLRGHYEDRGDTDREPPSVRTIQRELHDNLKYVRKGMVFLIKTPWHARYVQASSSLLLHSMFCCCCC